MHRLRVTADKSAYDVVVGRGAWRALRRFPVARYSRVFVLTEQALWDRWSKQFLRESGLKKVRCVFLPPGETSKTLKMVERVASALLEAGADRHALLFAFGGGVIGDLGGFVASTYMRGIDCVQAPTTVVAQVDSAVGGKTAVNVGAMKNLVGTFCPPRLVLAERLGLFGRDESERVAVLVRRVGPLPPIQDIAPARILELLPRDKKAVGGRIHWVVPERLGKIRIVPDVPAAVVRAAFRDIQEHRPESHSVTLQCKQTGRSL